MTVVWQVLAWVAAITTYTVVAVFVAMAALLVIEEATEDWLYQEDDEE